MHHVIKLSLLYLSLFTDDATDNAEQHHQCASVSTFRIAIWCSFCSNHYFYTFHFYLMVSIKIQQKWISYALSMTPSSITCRLIRSRRYYHCRAFYPIILTIHPRLSTVEILFPDGFDKLVFFLSVAVACGPVATRGN